MVIVQQFNQPFARIEKALVRMQRLGVSHVLISPPQKSHSSRSWWGRYQPVDFRRIEGPLGSLEQLSSLCRQASRRGLAVVADAVVSHLSNESRYLKLRGRHILSAQYPHFSAWDLKGLHFLGRGRGLPLLDTDSPWVRAQIRDYLHGLFHLGVRGFRFDSAKHVDPAFFEQALTSLPPLLCFGELVYAHPHDYPPAYWRSMRAYDFPLAASLKRAFAMGGDLGQLVSPVELPSAQSVPFVNHHDLVRHPAAFAGFRVGDALDRRLAHAYLLGRPHGVPLVYYGDLKHKEVAGALHFRRLCQGLPLEWLHAGRNQLVWRRGHRGLAAINKSGQSWSWSSDCPAGLYREQISGQRRFTSGGRETFVQAPRSAALWVREE